MNFNLIKPVSLNFIVNADTRQGWKNAHSGQNAAGGF